MVQSETVLAGNDISLKHPLQAASKMASLWPPFNKSVGLRLKLGLVGALKLATLTLALQFLLNCCLC